MRRERREKAVSITTGFILNVGIATIAVSIILVSLQGFFTGVQDDSKETEMRVVGERVAWELEKANRLANDTTGGNVTIETDDVAAYRIQIKEESLRLDSSRGGSNVNVSHDAEIDPSTVPHNFTGGQSFKVELKNNEVGIVG